MNLSKRSLGRIFLLVLLIAVAFGGYLQLYQPIQIWLPYWIILIAWQVVFWLIKDYIKKLEEKG